MRRIVILILTATTLALATWATATAAAPRPDAHDRALVHQLAAKVAGFQAVAKASGSSSSVESDLKKCPAFKKDPSKALGAVFALLPALLIDVVNQYKPQLTDLHTTASRMRPDAPVFRTWLTAETQSLGLLLKFDNHGKKIDYCKAAQVMLDKKSTAADIRAVLGVDPALIATLFGSGSSKINTTLTRLKPQMIAFFVAAGLSKKTATALVD